MGAFVRKRGKASFDPKEFLGSPPLTPLRKKQSSDHSALMLGDSVMIKDGVLGTRQPPDDKRSDV
jgi:hypothetical protein